MDIFWQLKRTSSYNKYILVAMDYATKWPEAFALKHATAESVVNCLIDLTLRVGIPSELLTDNGSNFISRVVRQYCQTTEIRQIGIYPYHPQTDGMVERYNSTVKHLQWKLTQNTLIKWDKCLPFILWADLGTAHKTTGYSPIIYCMGMK